MGPKKKLNRADFMFVSKTGETLRKNPGDINGIDFKIKDLHDCTVYLLDRTAQVSLFMIFCSNGIVSTFTKGIILLFL